MRSARSLLLLVFVLASLAAPALLGASESDHPLTGDALQPPPRPSQLAVNGDSRPTRYQPSAFLAGRVAIQLIFIESDGGAEPSTENWTPNQISTITGRISAALDWWHARLPNARLEFDLTTQLAPSAYEPIQHGLGDEGQWIADAMTRLGYGGSNYFDQVYAADDMLRQAREADWATTMFIVNSAVDLDGRFTSGHFAYAYVGGPFLVITSDGGPYGTDQLAPVVAHEFGHIFGALDQYASAAVPCTERSGYLAIPTTNSQSNGCGTRFICIMLDPSSAYTAGQVDRSALGQVGYYDTDGDDLPDPLDTALTLTATLAQPPDGAQPTLIARAVDQPFASPLGEHITINTVDRVEYQVDGGEWFVLPPRDGVYDSSVEEFSAALPLYDGRHDIAIRAVNSVGVFSPVVRQAVIVRGVGVMPDYRLDVPAISNTATITIGLAAPAGSAAMVSEDSFFAGVGWSPVQPGMSWQLNGNEGVHTLYLRFRDNRGIESPSFRRTVLLDRTPPTGRAFLRAGPNPQLELWASDGLSAVTHMQVLLEGQTAGEWQPFQPVLSLPLDSAHIQIRLRDRAGNISDPIAATSTYLIYLPLASR